MLLSVIFWAAYTLFAKLLADFEPLVITAGATTAGTILLVPVTFLELGRKPPPYIASLGLETINHFL